MGDNRRYEPTRHPGIRRRVNGSIVTYQVRWRTAEGRQTSATRDTLKEAIALRNDMHRRLGTGAPTDPAGGGITFGEFFLAWSRSRQVRASTRDTEASYFRSRIEPRWGDVPLRRITRADILEWIAELNESGLAEATVAKVYGIFARALRAGIADTPLIDPTRLIDPPKEPESQAVFLDHDQVERLVRLIDPHWRLLVEFLVDTGLRIGEVGALRVGDIDFLDHSVTVTRTLSRDGGATTVGLTKTSTGRRKVPTITPTVLRGLSEMVSRRGASRGDLLFLGQRGGAFSPNNFRKRPWAAAMSSKQWSGPPVTPHALRHTAISRWIATNAASPLEISTWAGHRSITTTYDIYGHLFPSEAGGVRDALEGFRSQGRADAEEREAKVRRLHGDSSTG